MKLRLLFGPVLIIALLGLMVLDERLEAIATPAWLAPLWPQASLPGGMVLLLLGMLAAGRAGLELARMFNAMSIQASKRHLTVAAASGVLAGGLCIGGPGSALMGDHAGTVLATAGALVVLLSMLAYVRDKDLKGAGGAVAAAAFTFIYMGVALGFLLAIRREHSVWVMVAVIMIVKMCDSGAYFTGTAIGKHKLIPWVSPGKTWEGLVGGLVAAAGFAMLFVVVGRAWGDGAGFGAGGLKDIGLLEAAVLGVLLGGLGQLGDLSASVVKRDAGVKDAGRILPGFGGMLDMLDSLVITAPAAYWAFVLLRS